jgi:hypothetical protein
MWRYFVLNFCVLKKGKGARQNNGSSCKTPNANDTSKTRNQRETLTRRDGLNDRAELAAAAAGDPAPTKNLLDDSTGVADDEGGAAVTTSATATKLSRARIAATHQARWRLSPSYMHSFSVTENYFVLIEQPLVVSMTKAAKVHLTHKALVDTLQWYNESVGI